MGISELKRELNSIFTEIVKVMTEIIDLSDKNVNQIKDSSEFIDENIKKFLNSLTKNISDVNIILHKKFREIDVDALRKDIEDSTLSFMEIISDLELLSLNTICQTRNLGDKRAIISFISAEIKRISDNANRRLRTLKENFNNAYRYISDIHLFYDKLKEIDFDKKDIDTDKIEEIKITSDAAKLVEYSQFHDIVRQQIEKIEDVYINIDWNDKSLSEIGKQIKFYEISIPILEDMTKEISEVMDHIIDEFKNYIYNLNTDIQNMYSKVGIVSHSYNLVDKSREDLFNNLRKLLEKTKILMENVINVNKGIDDLLKFKKDFYNLKIVTNIEIGRIGLSYLMNLVDSMTNTYNILISLIEKLQNIIKIWENFSLELHNTIYECYNLIETYKKSHIQEDFNKILSINNEIDKELTYIKNLLIDKDYLKRLEDYKQKIVVNLNDLISSFNNEHRKLRSSLKEEEFEDERFIHGYESVEIETIRADEEHISTIELF